MVLSPGITVGKPSNDYAKEIDAIAIELHTERVIYILAFIVITIKSTNL